ncbi:cryptochrome/photolyase family protein [Undibacterium rugosum]
MTMTHNFQRVLVWFRRDLRLHDHAALYHALKQSREVCFAFIFDKSILHALPADDRRLRFIHASVLELQQLLRDRGGELIVRYDEAESAIPALVRELNIDAVFVNRDYEPAAVTRDTRVAMQLQAQSCAFLASKDQVIFEQNEVLSQSGTPFSVFTPYKNAWLKKLYAEGSDFYARAYPSYTYCQQLQAPLRSEVPGLTEMGFAASLDEELKIASGVSGAEALCDAFLPRLNHYDVRRDYPSVKGPSYLSVHLRFGTISIRQLVRHALEAIRTQASKGAETWLSELIWRDFYFMILHHHPRVAQCAFKPAYDAIQWEQGAQADQHFAAWCSGNTGYPLVDAAMRQLNQSGYMHNRLRMVTACFLIKDLGIDWRRGEAYFAQKLLDFDLAANNGGWQWAASSGCDAQPYFRIFNPITQSEKFDAEGKFITRYLPQLARLDKKSIHAPWKAGPMLLQQAGIKLGENYPYPIVEHDVARQQTLSRYAVVKSPATFAED